MPRSLRYTVYLTSFFWILFLVGVFALVWCDIAEARSLVGLTGPIALIGAVSTFIEWRVWKQDV